MLSPTDPLVREIRSHRASAVAIERPLARTDGRVDAVVVYVVPSLPTLGFGMPYIETPVTVLEKSHRNSVVGAPVSAVSTP